MLSGSIQSLSGNLYLKNKIEDLKGIDLLNKHFKNDFYIEIQRHNDQDEKQFEKLIKFIK